MTKSLVERQFGPAARAYAECEVHRSGKSLTRLVELSAPQKSWRALDVATGAGHTAAAFAPHVAKVLASDITTEMLAETAKLATERGLSNLKTAPAEAQSLPFAAANFDLVTCRLAAHHFPDIERFVSETRRVLRPGGILAIVDNVAPDSENLPGLDAAKEAAAGEAYNDFERLRDPSHARALSTTEWKGIFTRQDFGLRDEELIEKEMAFEPWVERMHCSAETVQKLRKILDEPSHLSAFLKPRVLEGAPQITLREAIFIAVKI
ncbi:MAG: class I SAM-dependent methyltransferase [Alphaproteobacteria bacterium]|nr:class I SAM-dependent methyltransferase [Alphaproteobacteria bacterium]